MIQQMQKETDEPELDHLSSFDAKQSTSNGFEGTANMQSIREYHQTQPTTDRNLEALQNPVPILSTSSTISTRSQSHDVRQPTAKESHQKWQRTPPFPNRKERFARTIFPHDSQTTKSL